METDTITQILTLVSALIAAIIAWLNGRKTTTVEKKVDRMESKIDRSR